MSDYRWPTPAEVEAKRRETLAPALDAVRARVHEAWEKSNGPTWWAWLNGVDNGYEAAQVVRGELEAAGWATRIESDQRDGTALVVWKAE